MKFEITLVRDEDEAERNIRDAIKECLEVHVEKGLPLTIETRQIEVAA